MVRAFASMSIDLDSLSSYPEDVFANFTCQVIPKTLKTLFTAFLLGAQHERDAVKYGLQFRMCYLWVRHLAGYFRFCWPGHGGPLIAMALVTKC